MVEPTTNGGRKLIAIPPKVFERSDSPPEAGRGLTTLKAEPTPSDHGRSTGFSLHTD